MTTKKIIEKELLSKDSEEDIVEIASKLRRNELKYESEMGILVTLNDARNQKLSLFLTSPVKTKPISASFTKKR
ncbi:MAG: hypothetical protein ACMXYL_04155 [Candidatus Woesearchaeota archaeon]